MNKRMKENLLREIELSDRRIELINGIINGTKPCFFENERELMPEFLELTTENAERKNGMMLKARAEPVATWEFHMKNYRKYITTELYLKSQFKPNPRSSKGK